MEPTTQVLIGWLMFGGTHTVLSHPPIRDRLVARLGDWGFVVLYSLVALATFVPLVWSFFANRVATPIPLPVLVKVPTVAWVTVVLMFVALNLMLLGFTSPNPVSTLTGPASGSPGSGAVGALRITRHPAFMGVALAGFAHLLVNSAAIDRVFFGGMALYSVLGCAHQDWRRKRSGGPELARFYAETSFFPFVAILQGRNRLVLGELRPIVLAGAAIAFLLLFISHHRLFA